MDHHFWDEIMKDMASMFHSLSLFFFWVIHSKERQSPYLKDALAAYRVIVWRRLEGSSWWTEGS